VPTPPADVDHRRGSARQYIPAPWESRWAVRRTRPPALAGLASILQPAWASSTPLVRPVMTWRALFRSHHDDVVCQGQHENPAGVRPQARMYILP